MDDDTSKGPAGDDAIGEPAPEATESASRTSGEAADQAAKAASAKPRGRLLGGLGLLLALGALCGVGYLYYLLVFLGPSDELDARLGRLEASLPEIRRDLAAARDAQAEEIESAVAAQQASLDETRRALLGALNEVTAAAAPAPREWKIAEVEYLLRIANHRVLMEVPGERIPAFTFAWKPLRPASASCPSGCPTTSDRRALQTRLWRLKASGARWPRSFPAIFSCADSTARPSRSWRRKRTLT